MRAFFALEVPPVVGEKLMKLVPPMKNIRRGRAGHLHITLHFMADAPAPVTDLALTELPAPFRLEPGRFLLLPESGPVRIIAASVAGQLSPLRALHQSLAAALSNLGIPLDPRPYLPHITLARCDPPLPAQVRGQTPMEPREDLGFDVKELVLIESRPAEKGLAYVTLKRWAL